MSNINVIEHQDTRDGIPCLLSNIDIWLEISNILKTTLGPYGRDKLINNSDNDDLILTNDGATILSHLSLSHPSARLLHSLSMCQDVEIGDGTTSVVLLAVEILNCLKSLVKSKYEVIDIVNVIDEIVDVVDIVIRKNIISLEDKSDNSIINSVDDNKEENTITEDGNAVNDTTNVDDNTITKVDDNNTTEVDDDNAVINDNNTIDETTITDEVNDSVAKININASDIRNNFLLKVAGTALTSKILKNSKKYFSEILVAMHNKNYSIKKVVGKNLLDSILVDGICFEKTFSYAGHMQMRKKIIEPKILLLSVDLEWQSERDNAEIKTDIYNYQKFVNAEWNIINKKLDAIRKSGADVIFSTKSIGDYATQYFARYNIFSAGRVGMEDMKRMSAMCGCRINASTENIESNNEEITTGNMKDVGKCDLFEEKQIGKYRYNFITNKNNSTVTLLLRGGGKEILDEAERSLIDGLSILTKIHSTTDVMKENDKMIFNDDLHLVPGGGAVDMQISKELRDISMKLKTKSKLVYRALAQAFEIIPKTLSDNFGMDSIATIQELRLNHSRERKEYGMSIDGVADMVSMGVIEPVVVKQNMYKSALTAVKTLLRVDSLYSVKE
ncbi:T-complex protein 1 subunit eta subunit [Spraguea lophii 42_110]|uniref:CCT-eta n=1 Tax=Spraguea lophii (strain 42_110) TaxID=1358809 RepID=S7XGJ1_SPRLO|nr:T-complex protein 1 subunit eta subunit [Spraguea lophii 42_110]